MICKQIACRYQFPNKLDLICLYTVKCFQVLVFNTSNSIQCYSFICAQLNGSNHCFVILIIQYVSTQLNGFKYRKWLDISI